MGSGIGSVKRMSLVPRHHDLVEPQLPVQLVEAAAQRRQERVGMAGRDLRQRTVTPGVHGDHEGGAMTGVIDAGMRADVYVLGVGGAGVHPHLAAQHQTGVGLADDAQGGALARVPRSR